MAEVRLRYGREAYTFAQKTCSRYRLESQIKQSISATRASSPSAEFLLGDTQSGALQGAGTAADIRTAGVPQDSYTRVTPPLFGSVNVWDCYYLNKESCLYQRQVQNIEKVLPRCRTKSRRTLWSARGQQSLGLFVFIRAYSDTRSEPLYKTKTGYYDILEVSPTSTQTQIKTAYYKQSFIYHPDRNAASEDATVRFSEISEAYTVLGNKSLRKKYDRGLLSQSDLIATARPSAKGAAGSSARDPAESRRSVVGADSRVFDFDKFFKAHYSEQLQRERDIRVRKEELQRKKQETIAEKKMGRMMEMGVVALVAMALGIVSSLRRG
ncbi:dnaJ homolog subfamily C member 30, mitochondrial-like [Cebidichthys violaceus]|uniref:dnaJ homolog subfamily C member 30, mitochondrial-like n=1 Tax=Cebidichthys violaceus TaxID=271503 RepID=UPI0035CC32E1